MKIRKNDLMTTMHDVPWNCGCSRITSPDCPIHGLGSDPENNAYERLHNAAALVCKLWHTTRRADLENAIDNLEHEIGKQNE